MPGGEASRLAFFGLFALQHRGQESSGIAASNGQDINIHREMGLVTQSFRERDFYPLSGELAIGHTRYSTTGSSQLRNAQPLLVEGHYGQVALANNGNIINSRELKEHLQDSWGCTLHLYHRLGNHGPSAGQRRRARLGWSGYLIAFASWREPIPRWL